MSRSLGYRKDIEGLRAVAVLLVVVFHFHLMPGVNSGFLGVDIFFVISGFLITSIIRRQQDAGTFKLSQFWMHRVRRLAPALIATTLLTLTAGWLWLLPIDFEKLATQTVMAQLYVANIYYWRSVNYFGLSSDDVYLLHTWSLAVEEQFYIVFPLLMLAAANWFKRRYALVVIAAAALSFALDMAFVAHKPEATFYLMPTRAWELLAGSLLAMYGMQKRHLSRAGSELAGVAGVALLVIAVTTYRTYYAFPGAFAMLPVAAATLLIFAGTGASNAKQGVVTRALGWRPITAIGAISYPLYLVHWPINVFATNILGEGYGRVWRASMLLASVIAAWAINRFVETPSRHWLETLRLGAVFRIYGASLAALVVACLLIGATGGVPSRFSDTVARLAAYVGDDPPPLKECIYTPGMVIGEASQCRLGAAGAKPTWMVFGDSHAWAASGAVDEWLKKSGQSASFIFLHGCLPLEGGNPDLQGRLCVQFNEAVDTYLKTASSPSNVLVISIWTTLAGASPTMFGDQFRKTIDELKRLDKTIYVWEPLPGARVRVPAAMARNAMGSRQIAIAFSRAEYDANFNDFFDALKTERQSIAGTFSPSKELCGSGRCATDLDGVPAYVDNTHLSYSTRGFWAAALERQLPAEHRSQALAPAVH